MKKSTKHLLIGGAAIAGILWYTQRADAAPQPAGALDGVGSLFDIFRDGRIYGIMSGEAGARAAVRKWRTRFNNPIIAPREAYASLYRGFPEASWPWITDELIGVGAPSMLCHRGMADAKAAKAPPAPRRTTTKPLPRPLPLPPGSLRRYA
jgi:hypothetical protein